MKQTFADWIKSGDSRYIEAEKRKELLKRNPDLPILESLLKQGKITQEQLDWMIK